MPLDLRVAPDLVEELVEEDGKMVPDLIGELPVEPQLNGCVRCHTDKDRLYELAPPEPPSEEEESGGG